MFSDRRQAGHLLASALAHLSEEHPSILALPRGGVPVAAEVATALQAPLDVLVVRKIGAPFNLELGVGALVLLGEPQVVWNYALMARLELTEDRLAGEVAIQLIEARRRLWAYRGGRTALEVAGRTVILVDDGLATGISARAALQALRRVHPSRLVLAVPVGPAGTLAGLGKEADEIVCLEEPAGFSAVGQFYSDFGQTSDEEVVSLMAAAKQG